MLLHLRANLLRYLEKLCFRLQKCCVLLPEFQILLQRFCEQIQKLKNVLWEFNTFAREHEGFVGNAGNAMLLQLHSTESK